MLALKNYSCDYVRDGFGRGEEIKFSIPFISLFSLPFITVVVAQLVRALDCGSRGRGFKSRHPPQNKLTVKS